MLLLVCLVLVLVLAFNVHGGMQSVVLAVLHSMNSLIFKVFMCFGQAKAKLLHAQPEVAAVGGLLTEALQDLGFHTSRDPYIRVVKSAVLASITTWSDLSVLQVNVAPMKDTSVCLALFAWCYLPVSGGVSSKLKWMTLNRLKYASAFQLINYNSPNLLAYAWFRWSMRPAPRTVGRGLTA